MKRHGFTLIEMIAVVLIMALLTLVVLPPIVNQIQSQKKNISDASLQLIASATELYLQERENEYPMVSGATYCILLETLTNDGKLKKPLKDVTTGKEIPLNKVVKADINEYANGQYSLVNIDECQTVQPDVEYPLPDDDKEPYKELLLNGADPVLKEKLVPVTISSDGVVRKADITKRWYRYESKEWANAVILKDETAAYNPGNVIAEENIESYFVWIPKYSYQLWDLGEYNGLTGLDNSKVHSISIKFGLENTIDTQEGECTTPGVSGESGNCQVGDYMTHPAFLSFHTNGIWVGKFETGYEGATTKEEAQINQADASKVIIKPNTYSWGTTVLGNMFQTSYEYQRELESHMMKNTEWGAVVYLSHSHYGTNGEITQNGQFITGYANSGSAYNTEIGYTASTTGNITGIYDMSGGSWDLVMGYTKTSTVEGSASEITNKYPDFFTNPNWSKYYDSYNSTSYTSYSNRILGDATGEMGPFGENLLSSWNTTSYFASSESPWFNRGGLAGTSRTGIAFFSCYTGNQLDSSAFRLVLAP